MARKSKSYSRNSFKVKKTSDGKLKIDGNFESGSLTCRISGQWDLSRNGPEQTRLVLSAKNQLMFDQVVAYGNDSVSSHCKFGRAVKGIDELLLAVERSRNASFVTGTADGKQLIPIRLEGLPCSCPEVADQPLSYADRGKIERLDYRVSGKRISAEAERLAETMEKTTAAYRAGRGPIIDGIGDIVVDVFCWIKCAIDFVLCLARLPLNGCQQLFLICNAACRVVNSPTLPGRTFAVP